MCKTLMRLDCLKISFGAIFLPYTEFIIRFSFKKFISSKWGQNSGSGSKFDVVGSSVAEPVEPKLFETWSPGAGTQIIYALNIY